MVEFFRRLLFNYRKHQWIDPSVKRYSLRGFREWVSTFTKFEFNPEVSVQQDVTVEMCLSNVGELLAEFQKYLSCLNSGERYIPCAELYGDPEESTSLYRYYLTVSGYRIEVQETHHALLTLVGSCVNHSAHSKGTGQPFRQASLLWQELTRYIDYTSTL